MNKGILIVLLIALLPLVVFAQEEVDTTYLSAGLQDKLGINDTLKDNAENISIQSEVEELVAEPENLVIKTPELASAGSARDSPFYSLDRFMEKMRLRITGNTVARTQLRLKFAEERLAEAKKLIELNKQELAEETLEDYNRAFQDIELDLESAKETGNDVEDIVQEFSEMTVKHLMVLQKVLENVPDTAKPAIMKAIEVSRMGQEKAIMNLAQIGVDKELKLVEGIEVQPEELVEEAQSEEESSSEPIMPEKPIVKEEPAEKINTSKRKGWH